MHNRRIESGRVAFKHTELVTIGVETFTTRGTERGEGGGMTAGSMQRSEGWSSKIACTGNTKLKRKERHSRSHLYLDHALQWG